jgi:hypothetical protein
VGFARLSAAGLAFELYQMIPIWTTEITVTNHRLAVKRGWLTRSTSELQLKSIEQVNFHQGLLGRLFDFGRIDTHGTGVDDLRLPNIGCPTDLVKAIDNGAPDLRASASRSAMPAPKGLRGRRSLFSRCFSAQELVQK